MEAKNATGEEEDERSESAADLMEEFWFFGNLLRRKNTDTIKRWFSDPCPSSNNEEMMSFNDDTTDSPPPQVAGAPAGKSTEVHDSSRVLHRIPSLRPCFGEDEVIEEQKRGCQSYPRLGKPNTFKGRVSNMEKNEIFPTFLTPTSFVPSSFKKLNRSPHGSRTPSVVEEDEDGPSMEQIYQLMLGNSEPSSSHPHGHGTQPSPRPLLRAPSLPPCVGRVVEEQIGSPSNRQDSLHLSEILPPRRSSKVLNSLSTDKEMRRRILNRTKSMRSRGELESEEVQGFKDLGFTFDRRDLNPTLVNILPGLQRNNREQQKEEQGNKRPYLSESWLSHNFAPPIPKWAPKGGGAEDLKAHIKFWARAVASNVGQEC